MDARLQANPQLLYSVNGEAVRKRLSKDVGLDFLSQEEQECIQFFEDTIDSLEESIHEEDRTLRHTTSTRQSRSPVPSSDAVTTTSSSHPGVTASSVMARPLSPKDQEIIDLVRPGPDLIWTKEPMFNPTSPDFQSMMVTPESHVEEKPAHDSLPSEYNPPLPSGSFGSSDSHYSYHPPGCIPTPVLIAQKIAETQSGGSTGTIPSSLHRSSSLETEKPPRYSTDLHSKQGPPTSAKPTRFPPNISLILGSKEHHSQNVGNVNIHERKAQMLANLSGTSHPLLQEEPQQFMEQQKTRNIPTRSISFKDPSPDKSRMEALSKLGLNRSRAMSGGTTLLSATTILSTPSGAEAMARPLESSVPSPTEAKLSSPTSSQSPGYYSSQTHFHRTQEERNPIPNTSPPAVRQRSFSPPPLENKSPVLPPPEVTSLEFNSYGGKSIVVHPIHPSRNETPVSPTSPEPRIRQAALAQPSEFNSYGGKSKVMNTGSVAVTRNDLPDILSSHINKGQSFPAKSEPPPIETYSYGGKSRTFNPSNTSQIVPAPQEPATVETNNYGGRSRTFNPSATLPVKPPPPTPAPRPPRHSYHGIVNQQKQAQPAQNVDLNKRRANSLFRPQGITVQFGGRGASDESRKEALRKLGLLKES